MNLTVNYFHKNMQVFCFTLHSTKVGLNSILSLPLFLSPQNCNENGNNDGTMNIPQNTEVIVSETFD